MKKFGRKLVLSGLALAATAATLSTSTYAWYVSNTSADVDGGTAATMAGTSSGNLLVAQNVTKTDLGSLTAGKGAFSNSINISGTYDEVSLNPVTKCTQGYALTTDSDVVAETTYYTLAEGKTFATATSADFTEVQSPTKDDINTYYVAAEWMDVNGKYVAPANACQTVSFWVLSTTQSKVNVKTTVTNTTTAEAATLNQVLLNSNGAPNVSSTSETKVSLNSSFFVDAAKALRFEVTYDKYDTSSEESTSTTTLYDVDGFMTDPYTLLTGAAAGGDANAYYRAIMNKDAVGGVTVAAPTSELAAFDVAPGTDTLITIKIWLEGTDSDCFDSCRNQRFAYNFDLSTAE